MAVTLALDPDTGDLALRSSSLVLLQGAQATAQNIEKSLQIVRGTFGLNKGAGFPLNQVLTVGALVDDSNSVTDLGSVTTIVRDHLRSTDGSTGVAGVSRVLGSPSVILDESLPGLRIKAVVLDESSIEITVDEALTLGIGV